MLSINLLINGFKMKKNILLIDDDQMIHMSCEMMLYGSEYSITSITDPNEAMLYQELRHNYNNPDLIIVDYMMGKISGLDVIKSIRSNVYFDKTPIFLFTGFHENISQELDLLKSLKIVCVLPKPITKEKLLSKISVNSEP
jgi:CheY-like chemotaxis protein